MLKFHWSLLRAIPEVLRGTVEAWLFWLQSIIVPIVVWFYPTWRPIVDGPDFSRWAVAIPIGLTVLYGMLRVNYVKFTSVQTRLHEKEAELEVIAASAPSVAVSRIVREDVRVESSGRVLNVWQIWFENRPKVNSTQATAKHLTAYVEFCDQDWHPSIHFVGQWAVTRQPEHAGWQGIAAVVEELRPVHVWAKLLVLSRHSFYSTHRDISGNEIQRRLVFGLAGENFHESDEATSYPYLLPDDAVHLRITVTAENMTPRTLRFRLTRGVDADVSEIVEITP